MKRRHNQASNAKIKVKAISNDQYSDKLVIAMLVSLFLLGTLLLLPLGS